MPFIPTIDTTGIGNAVGAAIQVASGIAQRAENAKITKAQFDFIQQTNSTMRDVKNEFFDRPEMWADEFKSRMSKFSESYSGGFQFQETQDNFIAATSRATEEQLMKVYDMADKQISLNTINTAQNQIASSADQSEVDANIFILRDNKDVWKAFGGQAQAQQAIDKMSSDKRISLYQNDIINSGVRQAEANYQQSLDQIQDPYQKQLAQDSVSQLRSRAVPAISGENLANNVSSIYNVVRDYLTLERPTPQDLIDADAAINSEWDKLDRGYYDRGDRNVTALEWMSGDDKMKYKEALDGFRSSLRAGANGKDKMGEIIESRIKDIAERAKLISDDGMRYRFADTAKTLIDQLNAIDPSRVGTAQGYITSAKLSQGASDVESKYIKSAMSSIRAKASALLGKGVPQSAIDAIASAIEPDVIREVFNMRAKGMSDKEINSSLLYSASATAELLGGAFGYAQASTPAASIAKAVAAQGKDILKGNISVVGNATSDDFEKFMTTFLKSNLYKSDAMGTGDENVMRVARLGFALSAAYMKEAVGNNAKLDEIGTSAVILDSGKQIIRAKYTVEGPSRTSGPTIGYVFISPDSTGNGLEIRKGDGPEYSKAKTWTPGDVQFEVDPSAGSLAKKNATEEGFWFFKNKTYR